METRTAPPTARRFQDAVARLAASHAVEGAILASRDGLLVVNALPIIAQPDVFCAMHAAALGAAELALRGVDGAGVSLIADVGDRRFVSRAITESLFVIVATAPDADCHAVGAWMEEVGAAMGTP